MLHHVNTSSCWSPVYNQMKITHQPCLQNIFTAVDSFHRGGIERVGPNYFLTAAQLKVHNVFLKVTFPPWLL